MKYSDKLKDPKWQKKRLTILERDDWTCQYCYDTESTLHVHHLNYTTEDPWNEEDDNLVTTCEACHKKEHDHREKYEKELLYLLKNKLYSSDDLDILCAGLRLEQIGYSRNLISTVIGQVRVSPKFQNTVVELFRNYKEIL